MYIVHEIVNMELIWTIYVYLNHYFCFLFWHGGGDTSVRNNYK